VRRPLVLLPGFFKERPGYLFEALVGYEGDGVAYALILAVVVEGRNGEACVGPYLYYCHPWPPFSQTPHDALQDGYTGVGGVGVSGPEKRRYEVPTLAVEDEQRMVHMLPIVAVVVRAFLLSVSGVVC
jgi:hypothetical protein